jgi:hypothetical protein
MTKYILENNDLICSYPILRGAYHGLFIGLAPIIIMQAVYEIPIKNPSIIKKIGKGVFLTVISPFALFLSIPGIFICPIGGIILEIYGSYFLL